MAQLFLAALIMLAISFIGEPQQCQRKKRLRRQRTGFTPLPRAPFEVSTHEATIQTLELVDGDVIATIHARGAWRNHDGLDLVVVSLRYRARSRDTGEVYHLYWDSILFPVEAHQHRFRIDVACPWLTCATQPEEFFLIDMHGHRHHGIYHQHGFTA